jgi:hypothetical protein
MRERMEEKYLVYDHSKAMGQRSYQSGQLPMVVKSFEVEVKSDTDTIEVVDEHINKIAC